MKKVLTTLGVSAVLAGSMVVSNAALAGASANVGMVSNYVFRGVEQTESASASAGLDYEADSGLYVGTWVADVESGLEYDLYAGWSGEFSGVTLGLGGTYYGYTDSAFDEPYTEVNLSVGFGPVSLAYDQGTTGADGKTKYNHMAASYEKGAFAATYGIFDGNTDVKKDATSYLDLGYSYELAAGLDGTANYVYSMPENSASDPSAYLILGLSKSFDLM